MTADGGPQYTTSHVAVPLMGSANAPSSLVHGSSTIMPGSSNSVEGLDGANPWSSIKTAPGTGGGSESNYSASGTSRQQGGFERRIAWLEEDVALLQRRLRDEANDGAGGTGSATGDPSLRALVARLDGELAAERRARDALEARMTSLEEHLAQERNERQVQLRNFSTELETTMRSLITRIDEGLSAGASTMRERTDQTELRLRTLLKRVDEGLTAGAAALHDTLITTTGPQQATGGSASPLLASVGGLGEQAGLGVQGGFSGQVGLSGQVALSGQGLGGRDAPGARVRSKSPQMRRSQHPAQPQAMASVEESVSAETLAQSWDQLRQENQRLRERRAQLSGNPRGNNALTGLPIAASIGATPTATPSLAYPSTLQVPGSGIPGGPGDAQPVQITRRYQPGRGTPLTQQRTA